ncbi:MAG: L-serine ammonia-lyase, iron-sulfur-dependent subunit beta [Bacteroidetes bacterium]|nr:L-serine ammonia-lyase, iron-sulfur-dependent subunit beta [Bacteroidota bacterium]
MSEGSSIFDMIGPVMIGPSSSHTAGVVRIGRVARFLLRHTPQEVDITWYNSFATTYEGHGSDRALIGGLMNFKTDDPRIKEALTLAEQTGMQVRMKSVMSASKLHPNTVRVRARHEDTVKEVLGISRGGGLITISEVDGYHTNFTAQQYTLCILAEDRQGSIAFIASVVASEDCNIATMTVSRRSKNGTALLALEMDSGLRPVTLEYLRNLSWVQEVNYTPDIDM